MIPAEAVEAAELAAHDSAPMWRWNEMSRDECREFFTEILEAAAPHMLARAEARGIEDALIDFERESVFLTAAQETMARFLRERVAEIGRRQ